MSEPTTEAGQRLVKWSREGQVPWDVTLETVLIIEAEARAQMEPNHWTRSELLDIFDRTADRPGIRAKIRRLVNA